jgi:8-amino-7-oxononanoate synthase
MHIAPGSTILHARVLEQRVGQRLGELEQAGLSRRLRPAQGIDFSSNDYLGLATHPLLKERMIEAVRAEGCGATGSRLMRGHSESFAAVERQFAAFKGTESSLYFGSGYLANLAALTTFIETGDVVFSDSLNHASLIDGLRLTKARRVVFPHCDVNALRRLVAAERGSGQRFLITESLFSMEGDVPPLKEYAALCRETDTALIIDEAHAVGVYGPRGSGLIEACGIDDDVFLSINTAGKALGVGGAFVSGQAWAIDYLIQRARPFIFSTAPPPPLAAAIEAALTLVASEPLRRFRLLEHAELLRRLLAERNVTVMPGQSQIIPVILGDNQRAVRVAALLHSAGFDVRAVRPPAVAAGFARLRITVNSNHHETVLHSFASTLATVMAEESQACKAFS